MMKTHKIIAGVVALVLISLTAVFALNNNGRSPSTTKVPTGGARGFTCSCCNHHGLMEAFAKAVANEKATEDEMATDGTCLCGEDCGCCEACKGGGLCDCEKCKCDQCGQKAGCSCGDTCKCCDGCKGGVCTCEDCQCCDGCKK